MNEAAQKLADELNGLALKQLQALIAVDGALTIITNRFRCVKLVQEHYPLTKREAGEWFADWMAGKRQEVLSLLPPEALSEYNLLLPPVNDPTRGIPANYYVQNPVVQMELLGRQSVRAGNLGEEFLNFPEDTTVEVDFVRLTSSEGDMLVGPAQAVLWRLTKGR